MKLFRTLFTAILLITFTAAINAQTSDNAQTDVKAQTSANTKRGISAKWGNYVHLSGDAGFVLNSAQDRKFGMGGKIAFLLKDRWVNDNCYWTITVKAFNNPYDDGKFLSSIYNHDDDAFNYIQFLAGYRYTFDSMTTGFYVEPRLGYARSARIKSAFAFVPSVGYTYNNFDFALFCDMGFAEKELANLKKGFVTLGVSVGYNIPF